MSYLENKIWSDKEKKELLKEHSLYGLQDKYSLDEIMGENPELSKAYRACQKCGYLYHSIEEYESHKNEICVHRKISKLKNLDYASSITNNQSKH